MRKFLFCAFGLAVFTFLASCASKELVKTDLQSLNQNPEQYQDKRVIITTDLKTLSEDATPYLGRQIELSGFVEYRFGPDWSFFLKDEEGRSVKCFERTYRYYPWIVADMAVKRAERGNKKIIVVGTLESKGRVELDWIEFEGRTIDTDHLPYRPRISR